MAVSTRSDLLFSTIVCCSKLACITLSRWLISDAIMAQPAEVAQYLDAFECQNQSHLLQLFFVHHSAATLAFLALTAHIGGFHTLSYGDRILKSKSNR